MKIETISKSRFCLVRYAGAGGLLLCSLLAQAEALDARLDWAELHYASVPMDGFVVEVPVQVGQRVAKGEKLLQLNTTVLAARVKQAGARVAAMQPVQADAKREYNDAKTLYEQTVLSDVELQRAKMAFDIARAKLEEAEAGLSADHALLAWAAQYAPWDAWVIARQLETGQMIAGDERSKPLIILARADRMVAQGYATFATRSRVVLGQEVQVRYQGKTYPAHVLSLGLPSAPGKDEAAAYAVRVVFAVDPAVMLKLGDSASILMP